MVTFAGSGISYNKTDPFKAGAEAATKAIERMGSKKPDFVFLFSTEVFDPKKLLAGVRSITGDTKLIGCCTAGVIVDGEMSAEAVGVMTIKSNEIKFYPAIECNIKEKGREAGISLGRKLSKKTSLKKYNTLLILPDGITGTITSIVNNLYSILGADYKFSGAGAGDNIKFLRTYQFFNNKIHSNSVVAVIIASEKKQGIGVRHGWKPMGRPLIITKSERNIIYEFDGQPAFRVYSEFFGSRINLTIENFGAFAMKHPLGLIERDEFTIRDPIQVQKNGSIVCVGDVPENSIVRIMKGNKRSLITAATEAVKESKIQCTSKPIVAFVFDCVSRILLHGKNAKKEINKIRTEIGKEIPIIGFYAFGEIGAINGPPVFHNKTVVIHLIR